MSEEISGFCFGWRWQNLKFSTKDCVDLASEDHAPDDTIEGVPDTEFAGAKDGEASNSVAESTIVEFSVNEYIEELLGHCCMADESFSSG